MKSKYLAIIILVTFIIAATLSESSAADKVTVAQSTDKITIKGDKCKNVASEKFALSKDSWYIIKIAYTGAKVSVCQLSLATQKMIDDKETVGGLLTNWIGPKTTEKIRGKGSAKSEDYMIYVENAGGPWTIEILKNPKPSPVSVKTTFSGSSNKVTPFFNLKKGSATFTMNQKLKGQFSTRLGVVLYNATSGEFVNDLCHNDTSPTKTVTKDILETGVYVLEVIGGDSWEISYKQ